MIWLLQYQDQDQFHSVSNTIYDVLSQDDDEESEEEENKIIDADEEKSSVEQEGQDDHDVDPDKQKFSNHTKQSRELKQLNTFYNPTIQTKVSAEVRRLNTFYNPTVTTSDKAEFLFLTSKIKVNEPESFAEAWFNPDPGERQGWREAIEKELTDMQVKHKIWEKMSIQDIPENRKLIGSKWVFKKKKSGVF